MALAAYKDAFAPPPTDGPSMEIVPCRFETLAFFFIVVDALAALFSFALSLDGARLASG